MKRVLAFALVATVGVGAGILVARGIGGDAGPGLDGAPAETRAGEAPAGDGAATNAGRPFASMNVEVAASASSVETGGRVAGLSRVQLDGEVDLHLRARVTGPEGDDLGPGILRVRAGPVALTGPNLTLEAGRMRITSQAVEAGPQSPLAASLPPFEVPFGFTVSYGDADGALDAPEMRFTPVPGTGGEQTLSGEVSLRPEAAGAAIAATIDSASLEWTDAPERLHVTGGGEPRSFVSWAGEGRVLPAGGENGTDVGENAGGMDPMTVDRGGVTATAMDIEIRRGPLIEVRGTATATQVHREGEPQLRARVAVDLITPVVEARAGTRATFTWAPRNLDGDVDLCILRIRPESDLARTVNLRLEPMPALFGGEGGVPAGGDTTGLADRGTLGRAWPIASVIPPGKADRRQISFDVPEDLAAGVYPIRLVLEGNFDPMHAEVEVRIV